MKAFTRTALAAAIVVGPAVAAAAGALAQSRDPMARAIDIVGGARIGVSVRDLEDTDAKDGRGKSGVAVDTVEPNGPADKAGVKVGDAITEFDGERVRSVRQFSRLVQETPIGRSVAVALSRGSQRLTLNVTPERTAFGDDFGMRLLETMPRPAMPPTPPATPRAPRPPAVAVPPALFESYSLFGGRRLGVTVETLDDQLAGYFGVKDGVLVKSVASDSPAQKAGIKAGDVIVSVDGRRVYEASDVNRAIGRTDDDDFTLEIVREKKTQTLKGKLEARTRRGSMD